jgi:hypothetical protein
MSDDPRLAYCPLRVLAGEPGRRSGRCPDPRDCSSCTYFHAVLEDVGLLEEIQWICPCCLPPGRKHSGLTLLGHYSTEPCERCGEVNTFCQAAVEPELLPVRDWIDLVTLQAADLLREDRED